MRKSFACMASLAGTVFAACGMLLAGCAAGPGRHGPAVGWPPRIQRWSPTVFAVAGPAVTFTGEPVKAFAQVFSARPVPLAIAWAGFGDDTGNTAIPGRGCRALQVRRPGVVDSTAVSHRYARPGQHIVRIWARVGCGTRRPLQYAVAFVYAFPSAPPGAAAWPRCQARWLTAAVLPARVATGHVGEQVIFRNVSVRRCRLDGFPRLRLYAASGAALPTHARDGGQFLFPALRPHLVGLAPGQAASVDLGYEDNPIGNAPYQQACPAAALIDITPPGGTTELRAAAKIAPCNGGLDVSPVVPTTARIPFS